MEEPSVDFAALGIEWPPTEDELPCDDGMPMATQRHVMQLQLLMDPLRLYWTDRQDVYVSGNMFVYFSLEQVRIQDFRGPDFLVVLGVPKRERKSWVVWHSFSRVLSGLGRILTTDKSMRYESPGSFIGGRPTWFSLWTISATPFSLNVS